jgi:hydrogenase nickel incorporation protein HypA/HybF
MHELSLARDLLTAIERNLGPGDVRVVGVRVSVGSAAGIVLESLRFGFCVLAEGTRAEGARFSITTLPARCRCVGCGLCFDFEGMIGHCPACGRLGGELLSGDEMILQAIEVADV